MQHDPSGHVPEQSVPDDPQVVGCGAELLELVVVVAGGADVVALMVLT